MVSLKDAATFFILHELLKRFQADPEGFLARYLPLPASAHDYIREHFKTPANFFVDIGAKLLSFVTPLQLRSIRVSSITYGKRASQVLDVFKPQSTSPSPVLLFVHGGIWTIGNRHQYRALGQRFAAEGFVGIIVGYETWPESHASEQAQQVAEAIQYTIANVEEWGGDPHRIYVSGQSSGANIAALALFQSSWCAGFIGMAGPYDIVQHLEHEARRGVDRISMMSSAAHPLAEHSPTLFIDKGRQLRCDRVLLLHGEKDKTVPLSNSAGLAVALAAKMPVEMVAMPNDDHMSFLLDLMLGRNCETAQQLRRFCGLQTSRL